MIETFETAVRGSKAVMARRSTEVSRLLSSNKGLFTTYYNLLDGEVQLPYGDKWDELREMADTKLFPGCKKHIRFAALSLDGAGLPRYGDCSFTFRESMIASRASVYEENSALFVETHAYKPPLGHRATWDERAKLAVAKLGGSIDAAATADQFAGMLLGPRATPEEDRFIEVHIWGPMSIWTVEQILLSAPSKGGRAAIKAIRDRLKKEGVEGVKVEVLQ